MATNQNIPQNTPSNQESRRQFLSVFQEVIDEMAQAGKLSPEIRAEFEAVIADMLAKDEAFVNDILVKLTWGAYYAN